MSRRCSMCCMGRTRPPHSVVERIGSVTDRLATGEMADGAALFADSVVGQAGNWERMSPDARATMVRHAATFLDENRDSGVFALDLDGLARFDRPALLSYGDASPDYFASAVERIAEAMLNARVRVFAGAGHVPHRTHPAEYVDAVSAFLLAQG